MASSSGNDSSSTATSATPSVNNTTVWGKRLARNTPGNKLDPGWKHAIEIPGTKKLKCKYCPEVISGGVFRVKNHLAGTSKDVEPCILVPEEVKIEMLNLLVGAKQGKPPQIQEEVVSGATTTTTSSDIFKRSRSSAPVTLNTLLKKNLREEACLDICTAIYNNGIPFNFVNSDDFKKMCDSIAKHGPGFKPPSYHECRVKYLKQKYDMTMAVVEKHKALWKKTGSIYEAMDRAKEKIENDFKNKPSFYQPIWDVIDAKWERQLHRPLHAASYYLNPKQHYSPTFQVDYEVKVGLYDCIQRMVPDKALQRKIDGQLEEFKHRRGLFGSTFAMDGVETKSPAAWWESYGDGVPELQKFAIHVLSLTCSSSGCERNWSAFEIVHTKKRNRLKQETMNNVFVMANSRLGNTKHRVSPQIDYNFDDIESDDEWIVEPTCEDISEDVGVGEDQDPLGLDDHDLNEELRNFNDLDIPEFLSG
ncbi:hypothetical protein QN277_009087 [Acacia crassicarpa]|uniref:BED-type domain-containing protein n=1 Tax=Acacia crassicarpa TaxID=499986 RepID=A0AAE1JR96_9FABA|nr:hypothetical protein QN277_009087 [Acacia crassicarpa]